ncbi:MAG: DNA polymerase III subunit gamma/tau [Anaerohalosphaeraceae bacterium]|nr:DNA polymerase III subunit gamma/tau [Anaerohalosphaeraceae bacterium]
MAYTVLARRYRSQRFDDVVGQASVAQTLKNAIKTNHVAHAYLFSGTRGVGKTTMARILAKSLNCLSADEPTTEPCLECDSCKAINSGDDIDVIEIDGASNRGIDNIRELRQNAIYRPARARFKIYIIDEVHMLTNESFNALLKILEEPPSHVKFIFATTEPNKVLATIQSRCQRFDFSNISSGDIIGQLKKILKEEKMKFEDDLLIALARLANGSMRDGLSLLDQLISVGAETLKVDMLETFLGQPSREKIYELLETIAQADAGRTLETVSNLIDSGLGCVQIIDSLTEAIRDTMVLKAAGAKSSLVILTDAERNRLGSLCEYFDTPGLIYSVSLLEKLRWPIKNSDNPRTLLEASVLRLALSEQFMGLDELLKQLGRGGGGQTQTLKKNITPLAATHKAPPATAEKPVPAEPQVAVVSADTTIEQLQQKWDGILTSCRNDQNSRIVDMLKKATPVDFTSSRIVLSFKAADDFTKKLCENNGRAEAICQLLSGAFGKKIDVVFETETGEKPAAMRPRGAKVGQKTIDEATNNPAVKSLLMELDASIIDVSEGQ